MASKIIQDCEARLFFSVNSAEGGPKVVMGVQIRRMELTLEFRGSR
jgi:hypothetical protein